MEMTILGRTGIEVSVAGLGCGGHSRLGLSRGENEKHAIRVVDAALDLGINFIDTARAYGTESAVGKAIRGKRDQVVISTKTLVGRGDTLFSGQEVIHSLEKSLSRLETDYIDVFSLHGVTAAQYPHCVSELIPVLDRAREAGKIRFPGITETFVADPEHEMLQLALRDDLFDVVMVGFNMLNPGARRTVFPETMRKNVATQIMFAVRRALSRKDALLELVQGLIENGQIDGRQVDRDSPLGFVESHPDVRSIVEAAYRFCRHEPGATIILTGTGSIAHLRENVRAILADPLPPDICTRLSAIFGEVDSVSGN